ncbi:MAG: dTMP kinase [Coriobacteriales bacterium]
MSWGEACSAPARGRFITFEGGEGCGKSTQLRLLAAALEERGYQVLALREPGGTAAGERVREILLARESDGLSPMAELMLYEAARAQIVSELIRPALDAGTVVLCDRFTDSTIAYQGYGRGLDVELISRLNAAATGGLAPDATVMLFIDPQEGLRRAMGVTGGDGGGDRIEAAGLAFHERVAQGFSRIAMEEPQRVLCIGAAGTVEEVHQAVLARVLPML